MCPSYGRPHRAAPTIFSETKKIGERRRYRWIKKRPASKLRTTSTRCGPSQLVTHELILNRLSHVDSAPEKDGPVNRRVNRTIHRSGHILDRLARRGGPSIPQKPHRHNRHKAQDEYKLTHSTPLCVASPWED